MKKEIITNNAEDTQKLGEDISKAALKNRTHEGALVFALYGNLGGGKTTFLQGFAKGLGIKEKILSPTYVIMKRFRLDNQFKNFYHIDCYRIKDVKDIEELELKNIFNNPENIVAVEWPEKIKNVLPKDCVNLEFEFIDEQKRKITV